MLDHALATRLDRPGRASAAASHVRLDDGRRVDIDARAVLLATGGAGQVFQETTNPHVASGDGLAMAWRAGARVSDLEFVQFHPTVLHVPGAPRFLVSEAVRGEGARLINGDGEAFMARYDRARRSRAARRRGHGDGARGRTHRRPGVPVARAPRRARGRRARFPGIAEACARAGLDFARDLLPVSPAAHYLCGGVDTDLAGRTAIPGLFAAGEVACTRVHGANRLASNSLLEGLVFGARAAIADGRSPETPATLPAGAGRRAAGRGVRSADAEKRRRPRRCRRLMWRAAGLVRHAERRWRRWSRALGPLAATLEARAERRRPTASAWRQANIARVAWLIARAAARRTESRGGHRRADFPERDDVNWKVHVADREVAVT